MQPCVSTLDNEPQPDILLRINPQAGCQSRVSDDDHLEGAPELVFEVAAGSASYDLRHKLRVRAAVLVEGVEVPGRATNCSA